MLWTSTFSKLRPINVMGAAITFGVASYTAYQFYNIARSAFRPSPTTSPTTPRPYTSPPNTTTPQQGHRPTSVSDAVDCESSSKPALAYNAAQPTTSFPSIFQASAATDPSHSSTQLQQLQACGKVDEISRKDSPSEEDTMSYGSSDTSEEEVNEDSKQEAEDVDPFQQVLDAIDLEALAAVALRTRKARNDLPTASPTDPYLSSHKLSCSIDPNSVAGSYNIVYFITFSDSVKWIARIPGKGPFFGELDVRKMNSDCHTMRYIRSSTFIPMPEAFHWSTSSTEIGTPYALMSFLEGSPLSERWFNKNWSTEGKRLKALAGICAIMSQLYALHFDKLGSLEFDDNSKEYRVGSSFWQEERFDNPWGAAHIGGPWKSMTDYLMEDWDVIEKEVEGARIADLAILRLAVESIPVYMRDQGHFYPGHADCNYQNMFVDDDANITGIVDWDGSGILPCSMGFGRYPSWLTRDWDPGMYGYDEEEDPPYDPKYESPPDELSRYRQHYASEFQKLKLKDYDTRQTRLSHIVEAIKIARNSRMSRDWIVPKLLDHAFEANLPFKQSAFDDAYLAGKADEMLEQIREAFKNMWHAEWEIRSVADREDGEADGAKEGQKEGQQAARPRLREKSGNEDEYAVHLGKKMRSSYGGLDIGDGRTDFAAKALVAR